MRHMACLLAVMMLLWACGGDNGETPTEDTGVTDTGGPDTMTPTDTGQDTGVTVDSTVMVDIVDTGQPDLVTAEEYAYADIAGVHVDFTWLSANYVSSGTDAGLHLSFKTADESKSLSIVIGSGEKELGNYTNNRIQARVIITYTDGDVSYRGELEQEGVTYTISVTEFGDQGEHVAGKFEAKIVKVASDPPEYLEITNGAYRVQRED